MRDRVQSYFGWALDMLLDGKRVRRAGWNGKGMHLEYVAVAPYRGEVMQAFIAMKTVQGTYVPWLCSQTDMLARDWEEVE